MPRILDQRHPHVRTVQPLGKPQCGLPGHVLVALAVQQALRACGLAGYRNAGEFGIGRHLRDVLSAPVMVHNERILANIGSAALMSGVPTALREGWDAS